MKSLAKRILEKLEKYDFKKIADEYPYIPDDIALEFAKQVMKVLVKDYGWSKGYEGSIEKNVYGGSKGEINPEGNRIINATIDKKTQQIKAYSGFDLFASSPRFGGNILPIDPTPEEYAKRFDLMVMKKADSTKIS